MLQTTNKSTEDKTQSTQAEDQDAPIAAGGAGGSGIGGSFENLSTAAKSAKSKKANFVRVNPGTEFLTPEAKKAFIHLKKAFTKAAILRHFDLEPDIRIRTDVLGYAISGVLSQMTSDQHFSDHVTHKDPISSKSAIGQWHPVAFYSRKMIPAETRYKIHDQELLTIVKAIKTWCQYLEDCKYKFFVLIDYNNLYRFMDMKSLSSRQVC